MRPRLLDLFCGAGGAAMGYHWAGFDIVGVDIEPQRNYPFEFHQADALTWPLDGFDGIHASPPCQRYIRSGNVNRGNHPDLLPPTRQRLQGTGVPWVIENVPGAPMRCDIQLCGSNFGLQVRRHRWFEFSTPTLLFIPPCDHSRPVAGVYGHPHGQAGAYPGMLPSTLESWSQAMDIDWMTAAELADAIPPAYCTFIGRQLVAHISSPAPVRVAGNPTGRPHSPQAARGGERPSSTLPPTSAAGGRAAAGANGGGDARSATSVSPTNHALEQEGVA